MHVVLPLLPPLTPSGCSVSASFEFFALLAVKRFGASHRCRLSVFGVRRSMFDVRCFWSHPFAGECGSCYDHSRSHFQKQKPSKTPIKPRILVQKQISFTPSKPMQIKCAAAWDWEIILILARRASPCCEARLYSISTPSLFSNLYFQCRPPPKPPIFLLAARTRWQGTKTGIGLAPHAPPTARTAPGLPMASAISP
jgi:hypothetical protein